MADFDYDLFVIGAGSGGVRAARFAAGFGARVAIAESRFFGGTCVNIGCIPKKLFSYAAHYAEDIADAADYGWRVDGVSFDWQRLRANKDREIRRLNDIYERILRGAGVGIHWGRARVADPHSVVVTGEGGPRQYRARTILVATGGQPSLPEFEGSEHALISDDLFTLDSLPERALIVGGGYIAVEFAGILSGLGVETTLAYRGPLFLRGFDDCMREHLAAEMAKKGVRLRFNAQVQRIEKRAEGGVRATFKDGAVVDSGFALFATGRAPNVDGLGLEEAGVVLDPKGAVVVDEYFQSSVDSIYAIGDVVDRMQLTPVALVEGMAVARTLFGGEPTAVDYADIPTAVFCRPNLATVGLSEAAARVRHGAVDIYKSTFRELKLTLTERDERSLMKLVVARATGRVVGAHMIGSHAGEIIQGIAIAVRMGATKADLDRTIAIHPTAAEEFVTMRTPEPEPDPQV